MLNRSGGIYGLTILSPIRDDRQAEIPPSLAIRMYLAKLPRDSDSPFAKVSSTHMARLSVLGDVAFVGEPAIEEHLKTEYLVFESNFDYDLDEYLWRMANEVPEFVDAVWQYCVGYPGVTNTASFARYMKSCQVETSCLFADVNNKTVLETLSALHTQAALAKFIEENQGKDVGELQAAFMNFIRSLTRFEDVASLERSVLDQSDE